MINGFPGNLGDPGVSVMNAGPGATGLQQTPGLIHGHASRPMGTKRRRNEVSPSEGNEVRREDVRRSERLIVPLMRGNHPEGTLGRKGDAVL